MVTADANTGVVTEAAPIAKWAVGKKIDAVLKYYREKKGAEIEQLR